MWFPHSSVYSWTLGGASSLSTFSCTFIAPAWSSKLWLTSSISHISLFFSAQGPEFQVGKIEKERKEATLRGKKKKKQNKREQTQLNTLWKYKFGGLLILKNYLSIIRESFKQQNMYINDYNLYFSVIYIFRSFECILSSEFLHLALHLMKLVLTAQRFAKDYQCWTQT